MGSKQKAALMLGVMQGITGVSIDDIIDALPKGPTPNRYKPHQGRKEIAELDILKHHHAYAIAKGAIEEIEALK